MKYNLAIAHFKSTAGSGVIFTTSAFTVADFLNAGQSVRSSPNCLQQNDSPKLIAHFGEEHHGNLTTTLRLYVFIFYISSCSAVYIHTCPFNLI